MLGKAIELAPPSPREKHRPNTGDSRKCGGRPITNGDRTASALDALIVINHINARTAVHAEGESAVSRHDDALLAPMLPVSGSDLALASQVLRDRSRLRTRDDLATPQRSGDLLTTPQVPCESSRQPTRFRQTLLEGEEAAQQWDSLLDEIAKDADRLKNKPDRAGTTSAGAVKPR